MQTLLKTIGSSSLVGFLLVFPFILMEVVNRQNYNEEFPFVLFFGLWLNLFAISLILLPIVRARRAGKHDMADLVPTQGNTLVTNPISVLMISIVLLLFLVIFSLLSSLDRVPMEGLLNDPNAEQLSVFSVRVPSQFIAVILISIPVIAGIIASRPIANTLRAGGSLFAHPIHIIIVLVILFLLAAGAVGMIIDQWPCFIGVQFCD